MQAFRLGAVPDEMSVEMEHAHPMEIYHFRVPFASVSKQVQVNQTYFHMKGFALGLVLKQRQKAT